MQSMTTATTLVQSFNNQNTPLEDKQRTKTIINDALAIFTTRYANSSPPNNLIDEVLELAKAEDEELYRSSVSALAAVSCNTNALTNVKSLLGLTCILRNPSLDYTLGKDEIGHLLTLVLARVTDNAGTLEALNQLLDAMVDTQSPVSTYAEKKAITKQLKAIKTNTENSKDFAAWFQAGLALKTLEIVKIDESAKVEWMRRARALALAIESLVKIASDIAGAVATAGATAVFIAPGIIHEACKMIKNLSVAFDFELSVDDWYAKIKEIQALLALAAVEKNNNHKEPQEVLSMDALNPLFDVLKACLSKNKPPRSVQYAIVDSIEKIVLMRTDEKVLDAGFDLLLAYYETNCKNTNHDKHEKQAIRIKIIDVLLTVEQASEQKKQKSLDCLGKIKNINLDFYQICLPAAEEQVNKRKIAISSEIKVIKTLVLEAEERVNHLLTDNKGKKEIAIPLIGEGAIIKAPVDINQKYKGLMLTGNVDDIIKLMENEYTRKVLETDCEAARSVISKQVIGKMAQVCEKLNVNQEGDAPVVDLSGKNKINPQPSAQTSPANLTAKQGTFANKLSREDIKLITEVDKLLKEIDAHPEIYNDNFTIKHHCENLLEIVASHKESKQSFTEAEVKNIHEMLEDVRSEKKEIDEKTIGSAVFLK